MIVNIADILLDFNFKEEDFADDNWLNEFKCDNNNQVISVCLSNTNFIKHFKKLIYTEKNFSWYNYSSNYQVTIKDDFLPCFIASMEVNKDWNNIQIKKLKKYSMSVFKTLSEIVFRNIIILNKGLVLHAAVVKYKDNGIAFSAPSGTGKSTQANLWVKHKGANILNGDRPALRVYDDEIRIYGTPWSGSTNQCFNMNTPLKAIFMIEQNSDNMVMELSPSETLQKITARCFLPYFNEELMELALDNIGSIIQKIPVYLLKCRPDSGAVDVVASCLGL